MAARPGRLQAAWTSGEVAPEIYTRTDLKQYYSAAAEMTNIESIPQGGFRLLPRTRDIGGVRGDLAEISGTLTTSLGPHSGAATLATLAFASPQDVATVEIVNFSADLARAACVQAEYQDAADDAWKPLSSPFSVGTSARVRVAARPPQSPVSAKGVRIRHVSSGTAITFAISSLKARRETGTFHDFSVRPFSFSIEQSYVIVFGNFHADIWRNGVFVGAAATDVAATRAREMIDVQRFDTVLIYLTDLPTGRLFRDGADHEWDYSEVDFTEIPKVDLGGTYSKTADIWEVNFTWFSDLASPASIGLSYSVNGEDTTAVIVPSGPDWTAYAASVKDALEDLPSVAPGITVEVTASTALAVIRITFAGDGNIGNEFAVSARVVNQAQSGASSLRTQRADPGGEEIFSPSRGYPAAGIYYQDRLVSGGFKSKGGALLASPTGDYFSGNIRVEAASGGILLNLDTDGAEKIVRFARSKHLVIFTTDGEFYVADRRIDRTQPVNIVESTREGIALNVPVVQSETGLLFISKNRSVIFAHVYDDIEQGYRSDPISLLASHMIKGIRDAAIQRAEENNDAGRYLLVREDGLMIVGVLIRSQDVTGFVRWKTDGPVRDVCVDGANRPFIVVERQIGGVATPRLEQLDEDLLLDGAVQRTPAGLVVSGLAQFNGVEVWAQCDKDGQEWILGPFTVSGGAITLPMEVDSCWIGRWLPPIGKTLPPPRDVAENVVLKRPVRVHGVTLSLIGTTSVAIAANGGRAQDVGFLKAGMPTDVPPPPFTGDRTIDGLLGYSDDGQVIVTQLRPGRLQVSGMIVQVKI